MFISLLKEEMTRLQQEIENLKAERVPGGDEKVNAGSGGPVRCCYDLPAEGFLEDSSSESDAEKDQPASRPSARTLLNCFPHRIILDFRGCPFSSAGG